jgi:thiamine pyrophosphate-dependent acetolactate synthase large subunit-like protein
MRPSSFRAGPTLIDFPIDVLFTPVDTSRIAWGSVTKPMPFPPAPHPEGIKQAIAMLKAAKRPVLVTGTGASDPKVSLALYK